MPAPDRINLNEWTPVGTGALKQREQEATITQREAGAEKSTTETERIRQQMDRESQVPVLSPFAKKRDEDFAAEYNKWRSGDSASFFEKIHQLQAAAKLLRSNENLSGPVLGRLPPFIRESLHPQAVDVRADIERVIQSTLRETLGAQFTAEEGKALLARTFNPNAPEEFNLGNVESVLRDMEGIAASREAMAQYVETHDTLKGYNAQEWVPKIAEQFGISTSVMKDAKRLSPLTATEISTEMPRPGEVVVSERDAEINAQIQRAFDEGASVEELNALADQLYGGRATLKGVPEAVKYRDEWIKSGGAGPSGVVIYPQERPQTAEERDLTEALSDPIEATMAGVANAAIAGLAPDIAGLTVGDAAEARVRERMQYMREQSPWASFGGEVVGGLLPSGLAGKVLSLARPAMAGTRAAGLANVALSGVQGAAENPDNRLLGAGGYAASARLGDLAGRYLINPVTQTALDKITTRAPRPTYSQRVVAGKLGPEATAETTLVDAERLGLPVGLSDTTREAQAFAKKAAQKSPEAADLAEATYQPRHAGRHERAIEAVERDVAAPVDVYERGKAIRKAASAAADPYYFAGYGRPPMIVGSTKTPQAKRLIASGEAVPMDGALVRFFNTQTGKEVLQKAYRSAEDNGVDVASLNLVRLENGDVPLPNVVTWEMLDWARRGLTKRIEDLKNAKLDRKESEIKDLSTALGRLTGRLDELNPEFKQARAVYEKEVKPLDFLESGIEAANIRTKPTDVERTLRSIQKLPEEQQAAALQAYREGYATELVNRIDTSRTASADPYALVYGSAAQRRKMELIGVTPADFARQAELEAQMATTHKTVGSAAQQQSAAEAEQALGGPHALLALGELATYGAPLLSGANVVRQMALSRAARAALAHKYKISDMFGKQRRSAELSTLLMGLDPSEALQVLQQSRQAVTDRAAAEVPGKVASIVAGGSAGRALPGAILPPTYTEGAEGEPMALNLRSAIPQSPVLGVGEEYDATTDEIVLSDGRRIPSSMRSREALLGELLRNYNQPSLGADSLTLGR